MRQQKLFALILVLMMVSMPASILLDSENVQARPVEISVQTAEVFVFGWVNDSVSGLPIQSVTVYFGDMYGYGASNSTGTNVVGYYELNLTVTNNHQFQMLGIHPAYLLSQIDVWIDESWPDVMYNMELDPAPPRSSWLKGFLLDAITGLPLTGENLTAASDDYINSTQTDISGYFSMGFIPGDYKMGASSTGYESITLQFTLGDNWTLWRNITLEPLNCTLKGYIKGSGGPLDNAYASVEEPWNSNPFDDDYSNYTNSTGYYEFNLTRGTKNVNFRNDGYLSTSMPITLQSGDNWLNITLASEPADDAMIMGYITDFNTSSPLNNSNIRVGNANNSWNNGTWTDSSGYYEIYVISGDLRLEADNWNWGYQRNGTEITLVASQSIWQNITLVNNSEPQASIRGNITLDGMTPSGGDIQISSWNSNFGTGPDGSGYYKIINMAPGYYEIAAMAYTNNNDRSSIGRLDIVLQPGETIWYDFELHTLEYDSVIIGTVENQGGQIVEDAICFFSNAERGQSTYDTAAISDFQGTYELGYPMDEITYYMVIHEDYEMQFGNLLADQEWNWMNFTLDSIGSKVTVRGYLQDLDMNPITGHEMMGSADNWMNWTNTNASGYYEIDVPMGDVYIDSQMDSSSYYNPGRMFLNTRSGNDVWLNISVRPMPLFYEIRGRISESDDSNVTGATVTAMYGARLFTAITDAGGNYAMSVPEGNPRLSVRMDGYGYEGEEYLNINSWYGSLYWQNMTLDHLDAWIELPAVDSVADLDGDGKFDWLYVNVTINCTSPGEYELQGDLYADIWSTNSDGGPFSSGSANAQNDTNLNAGLNVVSLAFSGTQIHFMEEDGYVVRLDLYKRDNWNTVDRVFYLTTPYNWTDFDLPDVDDVETPHSFGPLDTDFDGLYNMLLFNTTVEILASGTYTFVSQLYNVPQGDSWNMDEIDQIFVTRDLDPGTHTIEFSFSGTDIYNTGWHLGLASTMMLNGSATENNNNMIWASQCYVPFNYTKFQSFPIDSYVYGWANDTNDVPIANLSVEIFNKTSKVINRTTTDENGYYMLGGWQGDWLLVINDGQDTAQRYQGNLTTVPLTTGTYLLANRTIQNETLDSNINTLIFNQNDWNKTVVDIYMSILADNETLRYYMDVYDFGNGDGFISEEEVDMVMGMVGSMVQMPSNFTDYMAVDGITYDLDAGSAIYDIGLVGDVASKNPVYIHQKGNFTAQPPYIPTLSQHELELNVTYDDVNTGSVSEGNSTTIWYVYPPTGWGRTGNNNTLNITFSGTDEIIIDPKLNPVPGDGIESEWTNVTISDSQIPTVGTISGNVTLDGRTSHFGVAVDVVNVTSGLVEKSGVTDIFGLYTITGIPGGPSDGPYNVTATKGGYISNTSEDRPVIAGQITWFNNMTLFSYPPVIYNIQYQATVTIADDITIYADVSDDGQVGDVTLWYNDVPGIDYAVPMSKLGVNTYTATIPAQGATGTIDFYIMANDTVGNTAINPDPGVKTINITEIDPPVFSNLLVTSDPTEFNDTTNISVTVTDMSAITDVSLYNHFTLINTTMNNTGGDYWLEDTFLALGTYNFTIWATDSFNNANFINGSFIVQDSTLPAIDDVRVLPDVPEFGNDVNISANITDLAGIINAWLDIQYPNGTAMSNDTMTHGAADSYYLEFSCSIIGQYSFTLWTRDGNGISNSVSGSFWINDTSAPTINNVTVPAIMEFGDAVNITADADDLSGLSIVTIQMFGSEDIELFNETMNIGSYWWVFTPPEIGTYNFTIWAVDDNNNVNSSKSSFTVVDTTLPAITSVNVQPATQEVFGHVNVRVIASDLDTVSSVYLNLAAPNGTWLSNVSLTLTGNTWMLNRTYDLLGDYSFTIWVTDPSGNAASQSGTITIEDTQQPVAIAGIDQTVNVGVVVNFNAGQSTDNYGIANYTWEFTDNGVRTLYGESVYWTFDTPGTYTITLTVTDFAGYTDTDELVITVNDVAITGTVTGTVFDNKGNPLGGVTVYVEGFPAIEDITDVAGRYTLENVPGGNRTIVYFHSDYERTESSVNVIAGDTISASNVQLVKADDGGAICGVGLILILIFIPIMFMLYKRKKAADIPDAVIDELFFMSTSGLLIKHFTRRLKPDMDQDILSGMLVAVQDFIKDSFRGEEGGLDELKFGKFQIVLGRGKHIIVAALILGDDIKPFKPQIDKCIKDIEEEFGDMLEEWDGDVESLSGSHKHINNLIEGKYA